MMKTPVRFISPVLRYRLRLRFARYARAVRYATGHMSVDDAWSMWREAQDVTGFRCLEGISESSVADAAFDRFGYNPELEPIIAQACARVADKWNSTGDTQNAAEGWVLDLIAAYAAADGLTLTDSWSVVA